MHLLAQQTFGVLGQGVSLPPVATAAPVLERSPLYRRQDKDEVATCGYIPLPNGESPMRVECPGGKCTTSGAFFGCDLWFHTTCYNSDDPASKKSMGELDVYCGTVDGSPNCVTASKRVGTKWLTNFECWGDLTGEYVVVEQTSSSGSSSAKTKESSSEKTTTTTEETSTSTSATTSPESTNSESTVESASTSGTNPESTSSGSTDNGSTDNGKSEAPIGAIVGGVVGGIALIALIAFGIWFIRFQKRKEARKTDGFTPYGSPTTSDAKYHGGGYVPMDDYSAVSQPGSKPETPRQIVEAPAENYHIAEAPPDNYHRAELG